MVSGIPKHGPGPLRRSKGSVAGSVLGSLRSEGGGLSTNKVALRMQELKVLTLNHEWLQGQQAGAKVVQDSLEDQVNQLSKENCALKSKIESLEANAKGSLQSEEQSKAFLKELGSARAKVQGLESVQTEYKDLDKKFRALNSNHEKLVKEHASTKVFLERLKEKITELFEANNEYKEYLNKNATIEKLAKRMLHIIERMGVFVQFNNEILVATKEADHQVALTNVFDTFKQIDPDGNPYNAVLPLGDLSTEYNRYFEILGEYPQSAACKDERLLVAFRALSEWAESGGERGEGMLATLFEDLSEHGDDVDGDNHADQPNPGAEEGIPAPGSTGTRADLLTSPGAPYMLPTPNGEALRSDLHRLSKQLFARGITPTEIGILNAISPPKSGKIPGVPCQITPIKGSRFEASPLKPTDFSGLNATDRRELGSNIQDIAGGLTKIFNEFKLNNTESLEQHISQLKRNVEQTTVKLNAANATIEKLKLENLSQTTTIQDLGAENQSLKDQLAAREGELKKTKKELGAEQKNNLSLKENYSKLSFNLSSRESNETRLNEWLPKIETADERLSQLFGLFNIPSVLENEDIKQGLSSKILAIRSSFSHSGGIDYQVIYKWILPHINDGVPQDVISGMMDILAPLYAAERQSDITTLPVKLHYENTSDLDGAPVTAEGFLRAVFWGVKPNGNPPKVGLSWTNVELFFLQFKQHLDKNPFHHNFTFEELIAFFD